jgi:hypothetical protein
VFSHIDPCRRLVRRSKTQSRARISRVGAVLLGLLSIVPAVAQSPSPAPQLVLGELYDDVRRESPRAEAARALVRAAQARIPSAKLPPDPELQLGFMNYTLPGLEPMEPVGMTQLQLMQMVPIVKSRSWCLNFLMARM